MIWIIFLVCNEWKTEERTSMINFSYNDELFRDLAVCSKSIKIKEYHTKHLNCESEKK